MFCTNLGRSDIPWNGTFITGKVFSPELRWDGFGWTRYIGWVLCSIVWTRWHKTVAENNAFIASLIKILLPIRRQHILIKRIQRSQPDVPVQNVCVYCLLDKSMVRRLYSHQKDSISRLDVTVYNPYAKLMIMEW